MSDTANYFRAALGQGLGMGWGDEAEAWLRSKLPGGRPYEEEVGDIRKSYGEFAQRNPYTSGAAELAGGLAPLAATYLATAGSGGMAAPAVAATTARTAGVLGRLAASPYARGAATGAATGTVSGAGSAETGQTASGALVGGTAGTMLGAAIPAVLRGAGAGYGWLRDRFLPSEETVTARAAEKVNRALQEAGMSPADIEARMAADRARGIPSTAANTDPALVDLAETVAQRSGPSARRVEDVLGRQTEGSRERTYGQIRQGLGTRNRNYYADEDKMLSNLRQQASTAYDEAYNFGPVDDQRIARVLETPTFRRFYDRAREIAENEAMAAELRGESAAAVARYRLPQIYGPQQSSNALTEIPDVRTLDYIKRGIDATIDRGFRGEGISTAEAKGLRDLRRVFVNAIDEATTDANGFSPYRAARQAYAGDLEVLDALRTGMRDFRKLDHEEVAKMVKGMSDAEKDAFRTGVDRHLYDMIMTPSRNVNAARTVIGSPEMVRKLEPLFDTPAQFNLFRSALEREAQLFQQSNRILGGSATARRAQARERFEEGPGIGPVVADAVTGGFGNSLTHLAARVARSAVMTDDVAERVSNMLMSSKPAEVAAAVKLLEDYGARAARGAANLSRGERGAVVGAVSAMQPAPEGAEGNLERDIARELERGPIVGGPDIEADIAAAERARQQRR